MFIEMIFISVGFVNRAFKNQEGSIAFLRQLIIGLIIAGFICGVLGFYWTRVVWLVEILIVPTLIRSLKSYQSVNKDSIGLLKGANETLEGARNQEEIEHRIKKEKSNG